MTQEPGRKRRRLIGIGFVTAFVLSTATIIYTGLNVRAPGSHRAEVPVAEMPENDSPDSDDEGQLSESAESDAAER